MKNLIKLTAIASVLSLLMAGCIQAPQASVEDTASTGAETTTQIATVSPSESQDWQTAPIPTDTATSDPTSDPTQGPTPDSTSTVSPPGPTVSHQEVSKWDYYVTYGSASVKCTALTRFNDGKQGSGDGVFKFTSDGLLIKQSNGVYADTYAIYSGANLLSADYSKTKYVGITITNKESHSVLFGLQGTDKNGKNIFLYPEGDPIALAWDNGKVEAAEGQGNVNGRYCFFLPASFTGSVLIPLNRIADSHIAADAKQWAKTPIQNLGFHLCDGGGNGVLLSAVFLCASTLTPPNQTASGIQNENYSYTTAQRIAPFWKNSTMYNESMAMIKQSDGSIYGTLLFIPTKINAVVDVYLQKEYKEGVDWEWVKGTNKIKWLNGSSIPYFTDNDLSGKNPDGSYIHEFDGTDNSWTSDGRSRFGNCLYCVSAFLYEKQICVSYTYDLSQVSSRGIKYTEYQGNKLPKTVSKLQNNQNLKVLFYGDSIFSGCDASGMYGRQPYMPYMHKLIEAQLQTKTTGKVTVDNIAVGGWTVENGRDALKGPIPPDAEPKDQIDYSGSYTGYDLLILSFGMNNMNTPMSEFKAATKAIIDTIKAKNPNLEVILVSCMNPNPRVGWDVQQKNQGAALKEIAAEKAYSSCTAVVDFYAVHKSILQYKAFASTTGNNINHPNDWLIRVYAQNILAAIIK